MQHIKLENFKYEKFRKSVSPKDMYTYFIEQLTMQQLTYQKFQKLYILKIIFSEVSWIFKFFSIEISSSTGPIQYSVYVWLQCQCR